MSVEQRATFQVATVGSYKTLRTFGWDAEAYPSALSAIRHVNKRRRFCIGRPVYVSDFDGPVHSQSVLDMVERIDVERRAEREWNGIWLVVSLASVVLISIGAAISEDLTWIGLALLLLSLAAAIIGEDRIRA